MNINAFPQFQKLYILKDVQRKICLLSTLFSVFPVSTQAKAVITVISFVCICMNIHAKTDTVFYSVFLGKNHCHLKMKRMGIIQQSEVLSNSKMHLGKYLPAYYLEDQEKYLEVKSWFCPLGITPQFLCSMDFEVLALLSGRTFIFIILLCYIKKVLESIHLLVTEQLSQPASPNRKLEAQWSFTCLIQSQSLADATLSKPFFPQVCLIAVNCVCQKPVDSLGYSMYAVIFFCCLQLVIVLPLPFQNIYL